MIALAAVLFASVKLAHVFTTGHESRYEVSVSLTRDRVDMAGQVLLKALDDKGLHNAQVSNLEIVERGHKETESFSVPKLQLDDMGLGGNFDYEEEKLPLVVALVAGYLPGASIEKGSKFEVSDRLQTFFVIGSGKLIDADAKKATIQYEINLNPNGGEPGVLSVASVFDLATGDLISAKGKLDIEGASGPVSIKRISK